MPRLLISWRLIGPKIKSNGPVGFAFFKIIISNSPSKGNIRRPNLHWEFLYEKLHHFPGTTCVQLRTRYQGDCCLLLVHLEKELGLLRCQEGWYPC